MTAIKINRHKETAIKIFIAYFNLLVNVNIRKRICATTCYLNPSEKDWFLAKMSEISGFDAIIFRIFKYIAFR